VEVSIKIHADHEIKAAQERRGQRRDLARLNAAAPELLEALKDCVGGRLGGQPGYVNALALQRAEAAIRKAEGRS